MLTATAVSSEVLDTPRSSYSHMQSTWDFIENILWSGCNVGILCCSNPVAWQEKAKKAYQCTEMFPDLQYLLVLGRESPCALFTCTGSVRVRASGGHHNVNQELHIFSTLIFQWYLSHESQISKTSMEKKMPTTKLNFWENSWLNAGESKRRWRFAL